MIRKILSRLALPMIATAALMVAAGPAFAQRGGHAGGFRAGGFRAGGVSHAGGVYHTGYGSYYSGYHPYYGYRAYQPYYRGYHVYPSYGSWYSPSYYGGWSYPYYGSGYYPYFYDSSSYTPDTSDPTTDPTTAAPPSGTVTATAVSSADPVGGTGGSSTSTTSDTLADSAVRITVRVPAGAELWFDGTKTTATGTVREFITPPLAAGRKYTYDVRARWTNAGAPGEQKRTIVFAPGERVEVKFPTGSGSGENAGSSLFIP